jgi:hypothetical protein
MPRLLTCPLGHQWHTTDNGDAPTAGWPSVCPVCGLAPKSLDATHSEVDQAATVAPPPTPPAPVGNAEAETLVPETPYFGDANCPLPRMPGYQILERLGSGGMGVVYKARQINLDRLVAIKFILSGVHAGPNERKRFHDEAQVVARLEHPNIVPVYEVGEAEGWPYITLQYVEGGSLAQQLNGLPQPPRRAAKLVETLARAIQAAHERGIVHRDLKPGNVLLAADGMPKITDFGLAKRLDGVESQTQSGTVMGTPSYMAPEQAQASKDLVGPATDIHALGAILYEQLTGRPPYKTGSFVDTILKVMTEEPTPPRQLQPKVPRDLETICLKCLKKDPRKRYGSAEELAEDLRCFQAGEPIKARPMRPSERALRLVKRYRRIAWALWYVATTLAIGALLVSWLTPRILIIPPGKRPVAQTGAEQRNVQGLDLETVALPADLDLVPRDSFSFACLRPADLLEVEAGKRVLQQIAVFLNSDPERLLENREQDLGVKPAEIERLSYFVPVFPDTVNESDPFLNLELTVVATRRPYNQAHVAARLAPDAQEAVVHGRTRFESPTLKRFVSFVDDRVYVFGPTGFEHLDKLEFGQGARARGPLSVALSLAAQGDHHMVFGVHPPAALKQRVLRSVFEKDVSRFNTLSALETARLTVNLKSSPKGLAANDVYLLDLALRFQDEVTAQDGENAAKELLQAAQRKSRNVLTQSVLLDELAGISTQFVNEVEVALRTTLIERHGPSVQIHMQMRTDLAAVLKDYEANGAARIKQATERNASRNNLKQLAIAMHNYNATFGHMPPAVVYSKDGKTPLYSWRVELLPFLEEGDLYALFHRDEPWNSEHNLALLMKMPKIYASPKKIEGQEEFTTFYQVFVGPQNEAPFEGNRQPKMPASFADGTGNTFLIVEAGDPVLWTKPDDIPYSSKGPLPKLGGIFKEGFNAALANGSVRFVKRAVNEKTIRAAITPAGGELLGDDWE